MIYDDIENALVWEYHKVKSKGYYNFLGLILLYLYFYYIPRFIFYIYPSLPYDDHFAMYVYGTFTTLSIIFWPMVLVYLIFYRLNIPYIESCRLNNEPWPWETPGFKQKLWDEIKITLVNQFITIPFVLIVFSIYANYDNSVRIPSMYELASQIFFFLLCEDFFAFWVHKLLHWGVLYKTIHKIHHSSKITFSIITEYSHPIEFVFMNSFSVGIGPLIYGKASVHYITWFTWVALRLVNSVESHSGYNIPWAPFRMIPFSSNAHYHDYHHSENIGNFSSFFLFWDTIMGTNRSYMKKFKYGFKRSE